MLNLVRVVGVRDGTAPGHPLEDPNRKGSLLHYEESVETPALEVGEGGDFTLGLVIFGTFGRNCRGSNLLFTFNRCSNYCLGDHFRVICEPLIIVSFLLVLSLNLVSEETFRLLSISERGVFFRVHVYVWSKLFYHRPTNNFRTPVPVPNSPVPGDLFFGTESHILYQNVDTRQNRSVPGPLSRLRRTHPVRFSGPVSPPD